MVWLELGVSSGMRLQLESTVDHPKELCCSTLIEIHSTTPGLKYPCMTKFDNQMHELQNSEYTLSIPLIPGTPEEMEDMLKLCSHVRFRVPQQVRATVWTSVVLVKVCFTLYTCTEMANTCLFVLFSDSSGTGRCTNSTQ